MYQIHSSRLSALLVGAIAFCLLLGTSSKAEAIPPILQEGTRPHALYAGIGPTFLGLDESRGGFNRNRFKLAVDWNYHFSGEFEGPAIGANVEQSFGSSVYIFEPGFKFLWDIRIIDDLALTIAPMGKAGYALFAASGGGGTDHAFNLAFGAAGRLILDDRWLVYVRPIHLDMFIADTGLGDSFLLNYDILIGGGVTL